MFVAAVVLVLATIQMSHAVQGSLPAPPPGQPGPLSGSVPYLSSVCGSNVRTASIYNAAPGFGITALAANDSSRGVIAGLGTIRLEDQLAQACPDNPKLIQCILAANKAYTDWIAFCRSNSSGFLWSKAVCYAAGLQSVEWKLGLCGLWFG